MKQKRKKRSLSGITGGLLCLLFLPVIILNLLLIADSYRNPEALPGVLGIKPAIVLSGSMEPVIRAGDLIFIHSTETEKLREGDVICYLDSGAAVTHRIIAIATGEDGLLRYQTKGDANDAQDRLSVTADQIQGIWKGGRIAGLGNILLFMQTTTGMLLFLVLPLVLFFLWDMGIRYRSDKKEALSRAELEAELTALKTEKENAESAEP